jgi:hypothetical protein
MNSQHVQELLEEYELGLLDPEMQAQVEAHLAGCASCRALADAYAETLASLPEALARVSSSSYAVPERLRDTVMSHVLASPSVTPLDRHETTENVATVSVPPQPVAASVRAWVTPHRRLRLALIAASLLLVSLLLWSIQLNVVLARERALRAEFGELVDQQEIVLEVIDSNKTERRVLLPPAGDSRAYGKVFTRSDMPHVVAMAARLTPPDPGESYHLWLTRGDNTFLVGTFRTNDEGFGLILYDDNVDGPQYSRAIVTLQPLGSTTPAEPPVLEWRPEE